MIIDDLHQKICTYCKERNLKALRNIEPSPSEMVRKGYLIFHSLNEMAGKTEKGYFYGLAKDKLAFSRLMSGLGFPVPELQGLVRDGGFLSLNGSGTHPLAEGLKLLKGDMFAKQRSGKGGKGSFHFNVTTSEMNRSPASFADIVSAFEDAGGDDVLIEKSVDQHAALSAIHPESVNTIRLLTSNLSGAATSIAATLRFGVRGAIVDNASRGGLHAGIDLDRSCLFGEAMRPGGKLRFEAHPTTGTVIDGHAIPYLAEALKVCTDAHDLVGYIPTIAWDVAISETGPVVIEANTRWDASLHRTCDPDYIARLLCELAQRRSCA